MQISGATARSMGLKVVYATRYKVTRRTVLVNGQGQEGHVHDGDAQNAVHGDWCATNA